MTKADPATAPHWLITGSTGRVGRLLMAAWRAEPPAATLLRQLRKASSATAAHGEILWDPLAGALPASLPKTECLIAYAGITPAYGADLDLNAALAEATFRAAAKAGIPRILITSSSAVYGVPDGGTAADEATPLRPVNAYGRSKAAMEEICSIWRDRGLEICCLRIGNVAGADALLLNGQAAQDKPLKIDQFSNGTGPVRSYIGPLTLARVTATLAAYPARLPTTLNIAAPQPISMSDLASAAGYAWEWQPAPEAAHQEITLDTRQLQSLYSCQPLDSAPAEMVRQWQLNPPDRVNV